jgi:hypothetical protein
MSKRADTLAAVHAVVAAIENTPQAVEARSRAILVMAAADPGPNATREQLASEEITKAERKARSLCAEAAVWTLERDPDLAELVTAGKLAVYIFRSCCAVLLGEVTVELELRDQRLN